MRGIAVTCLVTLSLCVAVPVRAAQNTLAIADTPLFATALVAEAEGYYAAEGLDLKIIHCVNGKRCLKHLTDGEAQFATVADTPIALAALAGAKFEILATITTSSRENRFVARVDRGIKSAADLRGKRIGMVNGTSGHYFTDALLTYYGIPISQVTLVPLDGADIAHALARGDVDAAGMFNTGGFRAVKLLGSNALLIPYPKIYTFTGNVVSASNAAGISGDVALKLLRALKRADTLMASQAARARATLAKALKVSNADVDAMWNDYDYALTLAQPLITTLEAQTRWAMRESLVAGGKMPDYLDYVRVGPLKSIDRRAVSIIK